MEEEGQEQSTTSSGGDIVQTETLVETLVELADEHGPGTGFSIEDISEAAGFEADSEDSLRKAFVAPTNAIHRNPDEYLEGTEYVDIVRRKRDDVWYFTLVDEATADKMPSSGFNNDPEDSVWG